MTKLRDLELKSYNEVMGCFWVQMGKWGKLHNLYLSHYSLSRDIQ